ncbi:MAG: DUF998 domain-containing protein [Candidatus Thermoplasmatota archaeon]|jgi:hypothetical membrane protein|nr:DUF998 domain-containing protein [Candidatus Thermoplasmatota archaeon]MCL5988347.1 DUF998 domain-containing protein [Candidatus Thermoplasmatota archaeon]
MVFDQPEERRKFVAVLLFFATIQFLLFVQIAEYVATNFSVSTNTISHLGAYGQTYIFNSSIIILGLVEIISAILLMKLFPKLFSIFLALGGIGAIGVGVFNENYIGSVHLIFALLAFLFSSLVPFVIFIYKKKDPVTFIWVLMGILSLAALVLYMNKIYLGLGNGGMERMIMYPNIIWAMGFGSALYYHKWD